jgi:PAS domain S-box-containing protein
MEQAGKAMNKRALTISPDLREVGRARAFISAIADEAGFGDERVFDITLASSEAIANAIEHSPVKGEVRIQVVLHADRLEVEVQGPGEFQTPDRVTDRSSRGLGLPLMAKLSDHLALFSGAGGKTFVSLTFYRPGVKATAEGPVAPSFANLAEENRLLDAVLTNFPDGFYVLDDGWRLVYMNEAVLASLGMAREEVLGRTVWDALPGWVPEERQLLETAKVEGATVTFERSVETPFGWREWTVFPVEEGLAVISRDITKRKRAEEDLGRTQSELEADLRAMSLLQRLGTRSLRARSLDRILLEIVDVAVEIADADFGNIQLVDDETGDLVIAAQRGLPRWWLDYWRRVGKGAGASCGAALQRGERVIVEDVEESDIFRGTPGLAVQLRAGVRAVQSTPIVGRSGTPLGMFSTHWKTRHRPDKRTLRLLDLLAQQAGTIVEALRTREKLHESEERFRAVQDNSLDRFTILKPFYDEQGEIVDFTYVYQNAEAAKTAGRRPDELAGRRMTEVFPTFPQTRFFAIYKQVVETGPALDFEDRYEADGVDEWFRATVTPVPGGIAVATQIITERKRAEESDRLYRQQLDIAGSLQLALLNIPQEIGPVRIGHLYRSATQAAQVGGDFYDAFEVKGNQVAMLVGDVAGHGIAAARTATLVTDVVHAFIHESLRPHQVLRHTNVLLLEKELPGFVSLFLAILDTQTGLLRYASAGHPETLLRRASGQIQALGAGSPPLGVFAGASWKTSEIEMGQGDLLLLYTDGVIEARRDGEFFGQKRLDRLLRRKHVTVDRLPHLILDQLLAFSQGTLSDDVALLALSLERGPSSPAC